MTIVDPAVGLTITVPDTVPDEWLPKPTPAPVPRPVAKPLYPPTPISTLEILRTAVQVLDAKGWRSGSYGYEGGPVCAVGAVNIASHNMLPLPSVGYDPSEVLQGSARNRAARTHALELLARVTGNARIESFNDHHSERVVRAAFARAIKMAEAERADLDL